MLVLALSIFSVLVGQSTCAPRPDHLRGGKIALLQREKKSQWHGDLADEEAERIHMEENLGISSDDDAGGANEERLDWDEYSSDGGKIRKMREDEEYSQSFIQKGSKKAPGLADEMEQLKLDRELGKPKHAGNSQDEERLSWDDHDESLEKAREEEEYSLAQKIAPKNSPADKEIQRMELAKIGHSSDDYDPDMNKSPEDIKDDYSFAQTGKSPAEVEEQRLELAKEGMGSSDDYDASGSHDDREYDRRSSLVQKGPGLADEMEQLKLDQELGKPKHANDHQDEERLNWYDDSEQLEKDREEEEYSLTQKGGKH